MMLNPKDQITLLDQHELEGMLHLSFNNLRQGRK